MAKLSDATDLPTGLTIRGKRIPRKRDNVWVFCSIENSWPNKKSAVFVRKIEILEKAGLSHS
ncbi:MAG: hypothetical protein ACQEQO_05660 [Thermodesulfobacteriota bacterium]